MAAKKVQNKIIKEICNADIKSAEVKQTETETVLKIKVYKDLNLPLFYEQLNQNFDSGNSDKDPRIQCYDDFEIVEIQFPRCKTR